MSVRQLNKLIHRQPMFGRCRVFSTSRLWANSVGYGDLWDDEHDCPDHGHFKDDPNKTQAGATISIASESYTKYVADDYEKTLTDVDVSLRRHNERVSCHIYHICYWYPNANAGIIFNA
jgi:hypothetical protein